MTAGIPENELQDFVLTVFKDENGELLFDIVHVSELDWSLDDFRSIGLDEVFGKMTKAK
jgi:hypothetical protein